MFYLKKTSLYHFRCYHHLSLSFHETFNFFYGENGSGKTNILEAIYFGSYLKSFRTHQTEDLISHQKPFFHLTLSHQGETISDEIKIQLSSDKTKNVSLNQQKIKKSDLISRFPVLYLAGDDIMLASKAPSEKRGWFDKILSDFNSRYRKTLNTYKRLLKQKNTALKEGAFSDTFDEELANEGALIIQARVKFLHALNTPLKSIYRRFFPEKTTPDPSVIYLEHNRPANTRQEAGMSYENFHDDLSVLRDKLYKKMIRTKSLEKVYRKSLTGPQKDHFDFRLGSKSLTSYGSQAQIRIFIYAMKLATYFLFHQKNTFPALLIDDVFSDLDQKRTAVFFELIRNKSQIFLASANIPAVKPHVKDFKKFYVKDGMVTE